MKTGVISALAVAIGASSAGVATAQDVLNDEIVVTAQRREQNAQDIGISITAFSGEQLQALGVTDSIDLVQVTPGLRNPQAGSGLTSSFSMRGLSQSDYGASQEAPVALYVDEVYQSNQGASQFLLFDVSRVEVLRGPQGTLFGRNATGGVVHFITERPSQSFGGHVLAEVGRYNDQRLEMVLNGPLTETVSGRLSLAGHQRDTIIDNRIGPDMWDAGEIGGRAQILFEPSANFDLLLSARASSRSDTGQPYAWAAATPTGFAGTGVFNPGGVDLLGFSEPDTDPLTVSADADGFHDVDLNGFSATAHWDLGGATLTSITDVSNVQVEYVEDADMQPGELFHYRNLFDSDQFSQELRLNGETGNLVWVAGLYYLNTDGTYLQQGLIADLGFAPAVAQNTAYDVTAESTSIFGQVEFGLAPQVRAIFGGRYVTETREQNYLSQYVDALGAPVAFGSSPDLLRFDGSRDEDLYALRAELDWTPTEDLLFYASYNRGVKGGGFNAPLSPDGAAVFIDPLTFDPAPTVDQAMRFDPEVLHAYEIGVKSTWADGRVRFNASAFFYDYRDFQALNFQGISTSYLTNNDAEMSGFDAELYLNPADGLNFVLGASYLDQVAHDIAIGPITVDRQVPYAPEWNLTAVGRYEWDALGGRAAIQANANYVSEQFFGLTNAEVLREPGYTLANLRASYTFPNDRVTLSAFVDNVTDEEYRAVAFDLASFFGSVESQYALPRTWGLSVNYRFGG